MSERLIDVGLEAMVASRPSSGWMVGAALAAAVGALAAAGRKLVVMNPRQFDGAPEVPQPTEPMDDFSIALWEYAKRALDESGLEVARVDYWGGVSLRGQENNPDEEREIAQIQFFRDADEWENGERHDAWGGPHPAKWYNVTATGELRKSVNRINSMRYDPATKEYVYTKPPYDVVGNICKWKLKKEAFRAPPPPAPPRAPRPEITTTTRVGRRRR